MTTVTQKSPTGYKQTDIGVIPADWDVKKLGDLGEIKMCRRIFNHETKAVGTIPFYKIGTFGKDADAYISQDLYDNYRHRFSFPKKGDILISAAGTIGRTIVYDGRPAYFQDSNIVWIDNNEKLTSNSYLYYVLQIAKYNTEGGTIQRLYNSILNNTKFICPTKPEQTAIANAISDADDLIAKLETLIEKKKNIRRGAMQELLTGKRRLPGFSGDWELKRLGDVTDADPENLGRETRPNYSFNYIALEDVDSGVLRSYSELAFQTAPSRARRKLRKEDVLVSTVRPNLKSHLLFSCEGDNWVCSTGFCVLRCREGVAHPFFIFSHMFTGGVARQIEVLLTGSNYPAINSGDVRALKIPIPDYEEQSAIAVILRDMDVELEKLESQLLKYLDLKHGMMQSLLTGKIRLI